MIWNLKYRSYFVAILACAVLVSCERDEAYNSETVIAPLTNAELLTFTQFIQESDLAYNDLQDYVTSANHITVDIAKNAPNNNYNLDPSKILKFTHASGYASYTIPLKQTEYSDVLGNIVVERLVDGTERVVLIEYKLNDLISNIDRDNFKENIVATRYTRLTNFNTSFLNKNGGIDEVCYDVVLYILRQYRREA